MTDIKTREVKKEYVKTIDHAVCMGEHVKSTVVKSREMCEHDDYDEQNSASSYANDNMIGAGKRAAEEGAHESEIVIREAEHDIRDVGPRIDIKSKVEMLKKSEGAAEESVVKNATEFTTEKQRVAGARHIRRTAIRYSGMAFRNTKTAGG